MLNRIVMTIVLVGLTGSLWADKIVNELVNLPHPGKLIQMGKLEISKEQKKRIQMEIKSHYVVMFQEKITDALILEKRVQGLIAKGEKKHKLKEFLDEIGTLKREAIDLRIDALYKLQEILTKEQWKKANQLAYKEIQ